MKCVQNAEKCAFLPLCVCVCVIIYTYVYILLYVEKHPRFHWFQPKTVHLVFYINVFFFLFFLPVFWTTYLIIVWLIVTIFFLIAKSSHLWNFLFHLPLPLHSYFLSDKTVSVFFPFSLLVFIVVCSTFFPFLGCPNNNNSCKFQYFSETVIEMEVFVLGCAIS